MLEWSTTASLVGLKHEDALTPASLMHFVVGLLTQAIGQKLGFARLPLLLVLNVGHAAEDYLENASTLLDFPGIAQIFSVEHIFSQIIGCKSPLFVDVVDHDSLQNFVGDIVMFLLGSLIAYSLQDAFALVDLWVYVVLALCVYAALCYVSDDRQ